MSTTTLTGTCEMCPHPIESHDAIARRFCAATFDSALSRGCICGKDVAVAVAPVQDAPAPV